MKVPQILGEEVTTWAWPVMGGVSQYKPVYGEWRADYTQSIVSNTVAYPVTFGTNDGSNGITLQNGSQLLFQYAGVYNIQISMQFQNTSTSTQDAYVWMRTNGADVAGSTGLVSIPSSHGGIPGHIVSSWNYVSSFNAGDYFEIVWSASNTGVTMQYYDVLSNPTTPTTPSAVVTISAVGKVAPKTSDAVWAAFEGGDPNFPLWIGTF